MIQNTSAASAKSYYTKGLTREDYYSQGQEILGRWGGRAAQLLGLDGYVDRESFEALCENRHPQTGKRLTVRTKDNRTVGYDLNFHVPKSVSVLQAYTQDQSLVEAFRDATQETMLEIEADMKTRVRRGGRVAERETANAVWAEFIHFTSRPVDGVPDPHLHAHCFVFNASHDDKENRFKAGQFRDIKRDAPYYEAAFHARLAKTLAEQGYAIERTHKGWEIGGVPQNVLDKFSRRTAQIEEVAERRGITDPKAKSELGAKTRAAKDTEHTRDELRQGWLGRMSPHEHAALERVAARTDPAPKPKIDGKRAMDYAVAHGFERSSVISERQLKTEALRHGVGNVTVDEVHRESERKEVLSGDLNGQRMVTTREVLAEEKRMLDFARLGRGVYEPLGARGYAFRRDFLSDEQKAAVEHILQSRDQVILLRGGAGVGKTTLMKETVNGIREAGKNVFAFAPSADASRGVLRDDGFSKAETVAKLLDSEELQAETRNQVIWIDESGLLSVRDMGRVFSIAERQNARVLLSGDTKQHLPVLRGDAMRLLETEAGLQPAEVSNIRRQRGDYKAAIGDISKGRLEDGYKKLDQLGALREVHDRDERHQQLARDYYEALTQGRTVLAVSPTHREGAAVTEAIRAELRQQGRIGTEERPFTRHRVLQLTEAQRSDSANYREGLVVQFHQNVPGFQRGQRVKVGAVDVDGTVRVLAAVRGGEVSPLPLERSRHFQVYERESLNLSTGDRLRITQNGFTKNRRHRLNNGAVYSVKGFTEEGDLQLANGWVVDKDYANFTHGFCTTSHAAQGKTTDRVLIAQGAESFGASSAEQFYVSASRARERVTVYTENKEDLLDRVQRSERRISATELMQQDAQAHKTARSERLREHTETLNRMATQTRAYASRQRDRIAEKYAAFRERRAAPPEPAQGVPHER